MKPQGNGESLSGQEIIYGLHSGCIFEGGGCIGLYKTRAGALAALMVKVNEEIADGLRAYEYDREDMPVWKEIEEGHWNNGIDEVHLIEYELHD